jgi:UDP-hydrolysing UDP-N-acetyl-D-glucosamine 2-epimerase
MSKQKRKVCVVVASRANYGRIKSVLKAIQEHSDLELQLIVAASALLHRFGSAIEVIRKDGFVVDASVYIIVEGENPTTMAKSTGLATIELATHFENLKPDVVFTVADRFETMATAISASYMNIPLAHTQGGEMTGSIDESVRHAITKLSQIHFVSTPASKDVVIRMGEDPDMVFVTGCPSIDCIGDIDLSLDGLFERYGGVGAEIDSKEAYLVVLQHPITTEYGKGFEQVNETLKTISRLRMQTVWLWPNVDAGSDDISKGLRMFREKHSPDYIHFYRNLSVEDYARLIHNCACLIGNSSSAIREGSFLGVPAVNIGSRQAGRERGPNVIDVGHDSVMIEDAVKKQLSHGKYERSFLYGDGKAGERIGEILASTLPGIQKRFYY